MRTITSAIVTTIALVAAPLPAIAQATLVTPYGGEKTAPVPQTATAPDDSPEDIAKDAARDLKDTRFYNRPGASRAQYDADWQTCRLIARGSRTPAGTVPMYYNPALVSPIAAGIGGGLGGMLGAAIAQGQQRRDNRRTCLMIKGWRQVEVPQAEGARIAAMTDAQRDAYFATIVGAAEVQGEVTERTDFRTPTDPNLKLAEPMTGTGAVWLGKKADPAQPFALAPDEAVAIIAFRRPDAGSAGRSGTLSLARYDAEAKDLKYRPKDWKKAGDTTVYDATVASRDRMSPLEVHVVKLTPGDYVLNGTSVAKLPVTNSYCFGAPTFRIAPGEVRYLGAFVPYIDTKLSTGKTLNGIAWTSAADDARRTLAAQQPALAERMTPAEWHNGATYACSGVTMDRLDLAGVDAHRVSAR